ncbi:MAG: GldG family protein [Candidatus Eisenbacteria bacterium]|nr:GldG family protein [Candidatus Eisenbacteria bacterium]
MNRQTRLFPFFVLAAFLFLTGGFLRTLAGGSAYLPNLFFLAGVVVLVLTLVVAAGALRAVLLRVREVAEPGPSLLWALGGAILCVGAGILAMEPIRYDLTERKIHEVSPTSKQLLQGIDQDVQMIATFRDDHPARLQVESILDAYRAVSGRIQTLRIDPDREPDKARELSIQTANTITIRSQGLEEIVDAVREPDITQAILRLVDPERPVVGFTVDHGEASHARASWNKLSGRLRDAGFQLRQLTSRDLTEPLANVRIVVVAGPTSEFLPGEVESLERFLGSGGRLAAFLDPEVETGLEPLFAQQGIFCDGRLVRDDSRLTRAVQLGPDAVAVSPQGLADHEVTRLLPAGVVLRGAQQVGLVPRPVFGTSGTEILRSEPRAKLLDPETGEAIGEPAARPLGVALEWEVTGTAEPRGDRPAEKPYARVVVVGDSDFLRDDMIDLFGNSVFMTRVFGWLGERQYLIQFPAIGPSGTPLKVGRNGLLAVFYVVQVALPLLAYGIGFLLWTRRR